jgi:hypothetical protein
MTVIDVTKTSGWYNNDTIIICIPDALSRVRDRMQPGDYKFDAAFG